MNPPEEIYPHPGFWIVRAAGIVLGFIVHGVVALRNRQQAVTETLRRPLGHLEAALPGGALENDDLPRLWRLDRLRPLAQERERRNDPALPLTLPIHRICRLLPTQNVLKFHLLGSSTRPLVSDLRV